MKKIYCPECGTENKKKDTICPYCGYPLKRGNGLKKLLVAAIICIAGVAVVLGLLFAKAESEERIRLQRLRDSQAAYQQAVSFEESFDYETAIYYYSLVISDDQDNYIVAIEKIPELTVSIDEGKFVAITYIALKNAGYVDSLEEVRNIKTNVEEQITTCKVDGVGYSITGPDTSTWWLANSFDEYFTKSTDSKTGFCVVEYKPSYMYNGWLSSTTNLIREQTSEIIFESAYKQTEELNIQTGLIKYYVNRYEEEKDLSVLVSD